MDDNKIRFNAIDFETATGLRASACSVAIVRVENAEIVDTWSTLIKPPNNYYSQMCIDVHGMCPSDTIDAAPFYKVYPEIVRRINGMPIVAHNEVFDRSVFYAGRDLIKATDELNLTEKWYCTYRLYKKIHGKNLKLNELCERYNITLNHHEAISDAIACAHLFINYLRNHVPNK